MESPAEPPIDATVPEEAVIDTNVLLDWLVFDDASVAAMVAALQAGRLRWVATPAMLDELAHARTQPAPRHRRLPPDAIDAAVARWCHVVAAAAPHPALACRDTDDQKFIDLALARRARWLFSRDKALLALAARARARGVVVCPPRAFAADDRHALKIGR